MKITIYGAGYVGLVTAACFAELGHEVCCADIDAEKIARLQRGEVPIYEPGLSELILKNLNAKRLLFITDMPQAVSHGLLQFIAVGTPSDEQGGADVRAVFSVAQTIGRYMSDYKIVINKSTVPLGTAQQVRNLIATELSQRLLNIPFAMVSNPEFLKEGAAIQDFMRPDRVVIGSDDTKAVAIMQELYAPLLTTEKALIAMDIASAELTKYAANAFLATKISFMNEMSWIAEHYGADIEKVRIGIGSDVRIGPYFLNAGCGYGGSCFPKDVKALHKAAVEAGIATPILAAVETVNRQQKQQLLKKINRYFGNELQGKVIALWGLAFKPNTDDMREASSRVLMEGLWAAGAKVQAYDPIAMQEAKRLYGTQANLSFYDNAYSALEGADGLAIVTEWQEFRQADIAVIKQKLRSPVIFDGRNLYDPQQLDQLGIHYFAIGRGI